MKRWIALTLLAGLAGGCSQFQARGQTDLDIAACAQAAPGIIAQINAGQMDANAQAVQLAGNSQRMSAWAAAKTTNVLSYWFGGKTILCNQDYCEDLDKAAVRFASALTRAATQPALGPTYLLREERDFIRFKAARDGRRSD